MSGGYWDEEPTPEQERDCAIDEAMNTRWFVFCNQDDNACMVMFERPDGTRTIIAKDILRELAAYIVHLHDEGVGP